MLPIILKGKVVYRLAQSLSTYPMVFFRELENNPEIHMKSFIDVQLLSRVRPHLSILWTVKRFFHVSVLHHLPELT